MISKDSVILALENILKDTGHCDLMMLRACALIEKYPDYFTQEELSSHKIQRLALVMFYKSLSLADEYKYADRVIKFVKKFNFPDAIFKTEDFFKKVEHTFLQYIENAWGEDRRVVELIMNAFGLPKDIFLRESIQKAIGKKIDSCNAPSMGQTITNLSPFFAIPFSVRDRQYLRMALDKIIWYSNREGYFDDMEKISKVIDLSLLYLGDLYCSKEEIEWSRRLRQFIAMTLVHHGYSHYNLLCSAFKCNVEVELKEILMENRGTDLLNAILKCPEVNLSVGFKKDLWVKRVVGDYWSRLTKENDPRAKELEKIFFPD